MIASLPMYTNEVTQDATDRFWSAWSQRLRDQGFDAPSALTTGGDLATDWRSPDLLISQTCGHPYASFLRGHVTLVATPHYDVEGCDGPNYVSWIIVRADSGVNSIAELRGTRAAINGVGSQSGYNSLRAIIAPYATRGMFFSDVITSGGHAKSMHMVADGEVDCAAIDAVSWVLTLEDAPELANGLHRLCATPPLPGLPFVTSRTHNEAALQLLRSTLEDTLADPALEDDLKVMHLCGASVVPDAAYDACLEMEQAAIAAGYPIVA